MLLVDNNQNLISIRLLKNYKYTIKGLELLADNEDVKSNIKDIIEAIYDDGFNKIDFNNDLFNIVLINQDGKFNLALGSGQIYKLLTLYEKQFNILADTISQILINTIYNKKNSMLQ